MNIEKLNIGGAITQSKLSGLEIDSETFGSNYIFNNTTSAKVDASMEAIGATYLRYPGGSVSANFDIDNPNSTIAKNGDNMIPLDAFLKSAFELGASVNFVFMPENVPQNIVSNGAITKNSQVLSEYKLKVKNFVLEHLLSNPLGVKISTIELGNEGTLNYEDGLKIGILASATQQAINEWHGSYNPDLAVQFIDNRFLNHSSDKFDINSQHGSIEKLVKGIFDGGGLAYIDAVQMHNKYNENAMGGSFTQNYSSIDLRSDVYLNSFEYFKSVISKYGMNQNLAFYDTEWNIKNVDASAETPKGLKSVPYFLELISQMIDAGVDKTNVWWVNRSSEDYSGSLANGSANRPLGLLYQTLNEFLGRTQRVDLDLKQFGSSGELTSDFHIFENPGKVIVYVHNMMNQNQTFDLDFSDRVQNLRNFTSVEINIADGADPTSGTPYAIEHNYTLEQLNWANGNMNFELDPYATVMLVFYMDMVLFGTSQNDIINGEGGNDKIYGGLGDDILFGMDGSDQFIFVNNNGHDVIKDFVNDIDEIVFDNNLFASVNDIISASSQINQDVIIDTGNGNSVIILNTTINLLHDDLLII